MLTSFSRQVEEFHGFESNYVKILYYDLPKNYRENYKSYEYNRLCTILEGSKEVSINSGSKFTYDSSEFILLPPNSCVNLSIMENTKAIVYEISDKLISDVSSKVETLSDDSVSLSKKDIEKKLFDPSLHFTMSRMNNILTSTIKNKEFLMDLYSQELMYSLLINEYIGKTDKEALKPSEKCIEYIRDNISSRISFKDYAEQLNMSPSGLTLMFKRDYGMTPKEYQNLLRLKLAKNMIQYKNITEVAYDLGFDSLSYFIKLFKQYYGQTPKQYYMNNYRHNNCSFGQ